MYATPRRLHQPEGILVVVVLHKVKHTLSAYTSPKAFSRVE